MFKEFDVDLEGFRETVLRVITVEKGDSVGRGPYLVVAKSNGYFVHTTRTPIMQPRFVSTADYKRYLDNRLWSGGGKEFKRPRGIRILGRDIQQRLESRSRVIISAEVSPCTADSLLVLDLNYWLTYWFGGCTVCSIADAESGPEKLKGVEVSVSVMRSDELHVNSIISSTCNYHANEHSLPIKRVHIKSINGGF